MLLQAERPHISVVAAASYCTSGYNVLCDRWLCRVSVFGNFSLQNADL